MGLKMSYTHKVATGFGALIVLNVGIAVFCVAVVRSDLSRNAGLTARYAEDLNLVERMRLSSEQMVSASRAYLLTGDGAYLERTEATRQSFDQDLRHLFDRYWQAGQADRRGVGLGLFIAKGIVEAHGGHLRVDSAVAQGSTFRFVLPTSEADSAGAARQFRPVQSLAGRTEVVVGKPG